MFRRLASAGRLAVVAREREKNSKLIAYLPMRSRAPWVVRFPGRGANHRTFVYTSRLKVSANTRGDRLGGRRMRITRFWTVAAALTLLVVGGLALASCGDTASSTTSSPSTTLAPPNPTSTTAGATVDAAALYKLVCVGCHPSIPRAPGGVDQVRGVITMGKGYMPPFSATLTVDEIVALATWVANGGR
jgi:cytochrome c5